MFACETSAKTEERAALLREEAARREETALEQMIHTAEQAGEELLRARERARSGFEFAI